MRPEKRVLLDDVLDGGRRETTLLAAGQILRRRRFKRAAVQSFSMLAVLAVALIAIQKNQPKPAEIHAAAVSKPVSSQIHFLTDEQLLALFPNTAVGLVKNPNGTERLIFPHPGDEQKYITHL